MAVTSLLAERDNALERSFFLLVKSEVPASG
jgi:hypothetical protein